MHEVQYMILIFVFEESKRWVFGLSDALFELLKILSYAFIGLKVHHRCESRNGNLKE